MLDMQRTQKISARSQARRCLGVSLIVTVLDLSPAAFIVASRPVDVGAAIVLDIHHLANRSAPLCGGCALKKECADAFCFSRQL